MTYRNFKIWYNIRCDEGFWNYNDAEKCLDIIKQMEGTLIEERKNKWIELEPIALNIFNDTNKKIKRYRNYL